MDERTMQRSGTLILVLSLSSVVALALVACGDDVTPGGRQRLGASSSSGDPSDPDAAGITDGGADAPVTKQEVRVARAEAEFRKVEQELVKTCGGAAGVCHVNGTYAGNPQKFLAGPDAYKSIKTSPGILVKDPYQSTIITKGQHAGPALYGNPLEKQLIDWLILESLVLAGEDLPSTDPISIVMGPNEVDLSKAATGITGVKLKFDASKIGTILSLTKVRVNAPAGQAVHIQSPKFYRVPANKDPKDDDIVDPADSFSNADQTMNGGADQTLNPGTVVFSGWQWAEGDKLRIAFFKLEKGVVQEGGVTGACKDPAKFNADLAGLFRGGLSINCTNATCHGATSQGGGFDLRGILGTPPADLATGCLNVQQRISKDNVANSLILRKINGGLTHNGGTANNAAQLQTALQTAITGGAIFN